MNNPLVEQMLRTLRMHRKIVGYAFAPPEDGRVVALHAPTPPSIADWLGIGLVQAILELIDGYGEGPGLGR